MIAVGLVVGLLVAALLVLRGSRRGSGSGAAAGVMLVGTPAEWSGPSRLRGRPVVRTLPPVRRRGRNVLDLRALPATRRHPRRLRLRGRLSGLPVPAPTEAEQ